MSNTSKNRYGVPIAIVIAGLLVAGTVVFTGNNGSTTTGDTNSGRADTRVTGEFRIPNEADHVRGNLDAPIKIVEFSDLECPFCARLHPTLIRIVEENDDVAWVYRHFPLTTIHSRALSAAVASECIARFGGNENFWSFVDASFANQSKLGDAWYREMATSFGIEESAFDSCIDEEGIVTAIQADLDEAVATGGRGTPHVVVVTSSGELIPFSGALPYTQVVSVIEQARNN